jgi:uncharacterized protein
VIFVDTGAWYAWQVVQDADHPAAKNWFEHASGPLITTDYVIDELLTLLKARGHLEVAVDFGEWLLSERACTVEYVHRRDIARAWQVFSTYRDKGWSFTDCVSRAIIERLHISTAASFDDHFRQFGTLTVVP